VKLGAFDVVSRGRESITRSGGPSGRCPRCTRLRKWCGNKWRCSSLKK